MPECGGLSLAACTHREADGTGSTRLRHDYDIYRLLGDADVRAFIGSPAYLEHKDRRFPAADEKDLTVNQAFQLSDPASRARFEAAYRTTSALNY